MRNQYLGRFRSSKETYDILSRITSLAMSKPRILFFNPVRQAIAAYRALSSVAITDVVTSKSRKEFFADIKQKYSDVQAIYRTSASGAVCQTVLTDIENSKFS